LIDLKMQEFLMADRTQFEKTRNSPGENAGCNLFGMQGLKFKKVCSFCICFILAFGGALAQAFSASASMETGYLIKHVYSGMVYIDAGSGSELEEGQRLTVRRKKDNDGDDSADPIGQVEIDSVVAASAAAKIVFATSDILPGDRAYPVRSAAPETGPSTASVQEPRSVQVAEYSQSNQPAPRASGRVSSRPVPREKNLIRGSVGIDYSTLQVTGTDASSSQFGFFLRLDASRIAGSHWDARGYYRGRLQTRTNSRGEETLSDLINRTYHLYATYDNPSSNWVFGAGRLYVPWASSLNTIDGFYLGRKFGRQTAGVFMGTTPDPTSWNYNADRQMGGVFYNIQGGSFESFRYDSTSGIALSRIDLNPDRQFGFFENNFFYKRYLSVYSNVEADLLTGERNGNRNEAVLSRSYFNVRIQPHKNISFNVNHNYFKNIPTFDSRLIGTGLLDEFLFQGLSGGFRISLPYRLTIFANTGRSSRTGDRTTSWNYLAGASASDILHSGIRLAYRYSRFDSSFGSGTYHSASASRDIGDILQFEIQGGQQDYRSLYTNQDRARFVNGNVDWFLGRRFFLGGSVTAYRGSVQDYNQFFLRLGLRFDNRRGGW
jgi:hypothetical protein